MDSASTPAVSFVAPISTGSDVVRYLLEQTGVAIELLLTGEGAATADVQRLLHADPRVRYIPSSSHWPRAALANMALDAARGAWLAFVDTDVELAPMRTERLAAFADATGADIVADNALVATGSQVGKTFHAFTQGPRPYGFMMNAERLAQDHWSLGPASGSRLLQPMFKAAFVKEHGLRFDETLRVGCDFHFALVALGAGAKYMVTSESHCTVRRTPHPLVASTSPDDLALLRAAIEDAISSSVSEEGSRAQMSALQGRLGRRAAAFAHFSQLAQDGRWARALLHTAAHPAIWEAALQPAAWRGRVQLSRSKVLPATE